MLELFLVIGILTIYNNITTMEIKLNAGDTFNTPTGCKAIIRDNQIIIEEKKEEPREFKDGDILMSKNHDRIVIFSKYSPNDKGLFDSYFSSTEDYTDGWYTDCFRHATQREKDSFFSKLYAKGLRWNAETKQMEKIRERAKRGENYLFIDNLGNIIELREEYGHFDNNNYNSGNYYLLKHRDQAEEDAKVIRAIYENRLIFK
jgi:hypothetical protein